MSKTTRLLTTRQVCTMLGVHRSTLDRWIDDGTFPLRWSSAHSMEDRQAFGGSLKW